MLHNKTMPFISVSSFFLLGRVDFLTKGVGENNQMKKKKKTTSNSNNQMHYPCMSFSILNKWVEQSSPQNRCVGNQTETTVLSEGHHHVQTRTILHICDNT
ncbi:hypothetical protein LXL04_004155 [Taraxacum kok-saghyz]